MDEGNRPAAPGERRHQVEMAAIVDSAVQIAAQTGVGPALEFMLQKGLDRALSLRVLTSPAFHRALHGAP